MTTEFTKGQTVYSLEGEVALYVCTAKGGGHIVQPMFEDGDGVTEPQCEYVDGVAIWTRVFNQAPQQVLEASIAEQQAKLALLRGEVRDLERQKREAELDQSALKQRLAVHQALARIDDLLSGRVTHYVIDKSENSNHNWVVVPADEFFKLRTHYSTVSLILQTSVYSQAKGGVQWKFSAAPDRDEGRSAFAFMSEAEARAKVAELVTKSLKETANHVSSPYWLRQRIQWADAQGVAVPDDVRATLTELDRREAEAAQEKALAELARAQAQLAALNP